MPYCLFIPGLLILAFVAYQVGKLEAFQSGARPVKAEVSWVPGGEDFHHHFQKKSAGAMLSDKEFMRRHKFAFWVVLPSSGAGGLVEVGVIASHRTLPRELKLGDTVEVLFNPQRPESAVMPGENLWVGLILVGVIGLLLTGVALAFVFGLH